MCGILFRERVEGRASHARAGGPVQGASARPPVLARLGFVHGGRTPPPVHGRDQGKRLAAGHGGTSAPSSFIPLRSDPIGCRDPSLKCRQAMLHRTQPWPTHLVRDFPCIASLAALPVPSCATFNKTQGGPARHVMPVCQADGQPSGREPQEWSDDVRRSELTAIRQMAPPRAACPRSRAWWQPLYTTLQARR